MCLRHSTFYSCASDDAVIAGHAALVLAAAMPLLGGFAQ